MKQLDLLPSPGMIIPLLDTSCWHQLFPLQLDVFLVPSRWGGSGLSKLAGIDLAFSGEQAVQTHTVNSANSLSSVSIAPLCSKQEPYLGYESGQMFSSDVSP